MYKVGDLVYIELYDHKPGQAVATQTIWLKGRVDSINRHIRLSGEPVYFIKGIEGDRVENGASKRGLRHYDPSSPNQPHPRVVLPGGDIVGR